MDMPGSGQNGAQSRQQVPNALPGPDVTAELIELRHKVARLEALLQALIAAQPTVAPQGSTELASAAGGCPAPPATSAAATAGVADNTDAPAPAAGGAPADGPAAAQTTLTSDSDNARVECGAAIAAAAAAAATPSPPAAAPAGSASTGGAAGTSTAAGSGVPRGAPACLPPASQPDAPSTHPAPGPGPGLAAGLGLSLAHTSCGGITAGGSNAVVAAATPTGGGGGGGGFAVAMAATRVVMHQLVLPADVNQLGICTGGQVLSWIDVCAGLSAKTLAHGPCVTASVDAVHFLRPCRLGCVVIIAAMVSRTFNTSMEVMVVVESEDMRTGVRHHCCSAHLTFVVRPHAAAPSGEGSVAPGLSRVYPTTPDHRAVWEGAEVRRQLRLERRKRVLRNPELRDAERTCRLKPITHREGGPTLPPAVTLPQSKQRSPMKPLSRQPSASAADPTAPTRGSAPGAGSGADSAAAGADPVAIAVAADTGSGSAAAAAALGLSPPVRHRVAPGCTTAYMTQSILPQHANTLNITFGGQVMSWMEQCAYISASRLRAPAMLTAAMDSVSFVRPTRVGDILYITAQVTAIFGSSLEVMVSVFGESPYAGAGSSGAASDGVGNGGGGGDFGIFHCADAFVTVVAVDERHGSPVPVPFELDPREHTDLLRNQGAVARRAERLALRGEFTAAECTRMSLDGSHAYSPPPEVSGADDGDGDSGSVLDAMPPL